MTEIEEIKYNEISSQLEGKTLECYYLREELSNLKKENEQLKALNQKMKCCSNCSKGQSGFCMGMGCIDENYKMWKLYEK